MMELQSEIHNQPELQSEIHNQPELNISDFVKQALGQPSLEPIVASLAGLDVFEVGGEPVVSLISGALCGLGAGSVARSKTLSQSALDVCWEKLNTGYWRDVPLIWRTLYSYSAVAQCLAHAADGCYREALRICDMGLLMGAPLPDSYLSRLASSLSNSLREPTTSRSPQPASKHVAAPSFDGQGLRVQRIECPSLESFERRYMKQQVPVVVTGAIDHWPALTSRPWSIPYLKEVAGNRTVPIEIGSRYTDETWSQKLMTISSFVDSISSSPSASSGSGDVKDSSVLYLAQHQLFDQLPELRSDICVPDYCCLCEEDADAEPIVNAWIGPCGTVSPLHHDPYHNVFAQVVGSKLIRIYSPAYSEMLYPHESTMLGNTSQVDCEHPDLARFPKFSEAPYWECVVSSGDLLYIPPKFWHFVRSLSVSFSVSFWWK